MSSGNTKTKFDCTETKRRIVIVDDVDALRTYVQQTDVEHKSIEQTVEPMPRAQSRTQKI